MKKIYFLITFLLCCHRIWAQQVAWERTYGPPGTKIKRCELLPDGNYALLLQNGFTISVAKVDAAGNQVWLQPLGAGAFINNNSSILKAVPAGIIAGMIEIGDPDTIWLLAIKLNLQGGQVWRKTLPTGRDGNTAANLHVRSTNEYLVLSYSTDQSIVIGQGGQKYTTHSIDSSGNINWRKVYMNPLGAGGVPRDIINYRPNGYMFCGHMAFKSCTHM